MKEEAYQAEKVKFQKSETDEADHSSTAVLEKYLQKKNQISTLLKLYENTHQTKLITDIENPLDMIQELLAKLNENKKQLSKFAKKYAEIQIDANSICNQFPPSVREAIKTGFQECLSYHNIWSSRNGVVLMKPDSHKYCEISNNEIRLSKKRNEKLSTMVALLNKIPQNCIMEVKLYLTDLHTSFKFAKEDYIRLKIYPEEDQFHFSSESLRCLTIDLDCLEKDDLVNDDKLTFKLDMFQKKAQAFCNDNLIKYSQEIKMKKVEIKGYKFVPALEFNFGSKSRIKKLNFHVQLDYLHRD